MTTAPRPIYSKFFWKDWHSKTVHLSPAAYTAYHRLLGFAAMVSEDFHSIPDDDAILARASGLGRKAWNQVREQVLAFFEAWPDPSKESAGGLSQPPRWSSARLREEATAWAQHCEKQRRNVYQRWVRGNTKAIPEAYPARSREISDIRKQEDLAQAHTTVSKPYAVPRAPRHARVTLNDPLTEIRALEEAAALETEDDRRAGAEAIGEIIAGLGADQASKSEDP